MSDGATDAPSDVQRDTISEVANDAPNDTPVDTSDASPSDAATDGASDDAASDAGTDAGADDASGGDTGASDSGTSDTGSSDSGGSDTGLSDGGAGDTGATDSGVADARDENTYVWPGDPACMNCHGNVDNPAPPIDMRGKTATTEPTIGAHQKHLASSAWHATVDCSQCHVVPDVPSYDPAVPTHLNGKQDVVWGTIARSGTFSTSNYTCSGTYCHGGTLLPDSTGASTNRTPLWTQVDGTQAVCGTACHSLPPGGRHPQSNDCVNCHGNVVSNVTIGAQVIATFANPALHVNGRVDVNGNVGCTSCHGEPAKDDPAPPVGTHGETATSTRAVGAHQSHLGQSAWHRDVACTDCHAVPVSPNHSDGKVDFAFGALSSAHGATPIFDSATISCAGVYCHGTTLLGANAGGLVRRTPTWTTVNGAFEACGSSCHTNPPGGNHPANTSCPTCHSDVIATYVGGPNPTATWTNAALHVDGTVQVQSDLGCTSCHGDPSTGNKAPPLGTHGETETTSRAVGAHQAHLTASTGHRDVVCEDCHTVPTSTSHSNGAVELTWGGVATALGATPSFDGGTVTCSGVYCHGATLLGANAGGTVSRSPVWTTVDGTFDACGTTCHTNPPGGTHPQNAACPTCHSAVIAAYSAGNPPSVTWANGKLHVDGKVDVGNVTCTTCHGDSGANDPAPPRGTHGETLPTQAAVGAHQTHLTPSSWHRDGQCADCHVVPASVSHSNASVDVSFGAIASSQSAAPAFDFATLTCAGVYCHGATLLGANTGGVVRRSPVWTQVDGTFNACGASCHTTPPGGTHPKSTACESCHRAVIESFNEANPAASLWLNPDLHGDGKVDVAALTCTSCHGTAAVNAAPPKGTNNETLTSQPAVGAHQAHLGASGWHREVDCSDCHSVPASVLHTDGKIDLAWSATAAADGATPAFDATALTCSGVYCHGTTLLGARAGGAVKRTPVWTTVDGSFEACGSSCHTNPPGGAHPQNAACSTCHGDVIAAYADGNPPQVAWKDPARHVDGTVDVKQLTCTSCHGDSTKNDPAPPLGTHGETLSSQPAVGTHQQHLGTSNWHREVQCADCHVVPASTATSHSNGTIDFGWGGPSTNDGATPTFAAGTLTCSGVYCHGATLLGPNAGGTVSRSPVWTDTTGVYEACGKSCHTLPPGGTHPASTACPTCHTPVISSFTAGNPPTVVWNDPSLHIDGKHDLVDLTCTSCHGDSATANPAPPKGTHGETLTTDHAVGAHAQHLGTSTWHRDGQCNDCHVVPASTTHSDGTTNVSWSGPAVADGASPSYTSATATCSAVYCHGTTLGAAKAGGTVSRAPVWTTVNGSYDTCGATCHTNPPGGTHPAHTDCRICHAAVVATFNATTQATTWADRTLHVDGTIQSNKYHDLANWTSPVGNANHHGSQYFLQNQQRDEHGTACTDCHGANLDGGTVGVSCNNTSCHRGTDWKSCTFCHGTLPSQINPPVGVGGETATSTLAVGRHVAHLAASTTHVAFACNTCHTVPAAGDVAHATGYVASTSLATTGHHGDVTFANGGTGMTFTVTATTGNPITGRGTCTGACHSNGRGGAPVTTPYWAGGTWTVGGCGTCHAASPSTGQHGKHSGEATCANCHPAATAATHMNGARDVNTTITPSSGTGSVTVSRALTQCGTGNVGCTGTCHGKSHAPRCW